MSGVGTGLADHSKLHCCVYFNGTRGGGSRGAEWSLSSPDCCAPFCFLFWAHGRCDATCRAGYICGGGYRSGQPRKGGAYGVWLQHTYCRFALYVHFQHSASLNRYRWPFYFSRHADLGLSRKHGVCCGNTAVFLATKSSVGGRRPAAGGVFIVSSGFSGEPLGAAF